MRVIMPGHTYELENFEKDGSQVIGFIHKELNDNGVFTTVNDGTTNEEMLAVLIDRMQYLQKKSPCRENALAITKLEECLMWLNKRTADRRTRGVEGTPAP